MTLQNDDNVKNVSKILQDNRDKEETVLSGRKLDLNVERTLCARRTHKLTEGRSYGRCTLHRRRQEGRAEGRRDRQNSDKASAARNITATNRAALSLKDQQRQAD